ncbi:MAG: DMT family transporter [Planctomycetes bacterium]|nr:DMT family transporter [Planctomycetota bacterium]
MDVKKIGVLAILGSSFMWALEPVAAKMAYRGSDFLETSAVRAVVITIVAFLYVALTNKANLKVGGRQVGPLVYIALAGTIAADTLYFFAIARSQVINVVMLAHMQPIFIVLFGFFVMRENLTRYDYAGIAVMIVSGLMVTAGTPENLASLRLGGMGDVYVLLATVLWATTAIAMRKYLRTVHSGVITFYRFSIASVLFTIYLLADRPEIRLNIYHVAVGLISAAGTILYYESLKRLKAAQVGALELSTPLFAMVLVLFVPTETVMPMQVAGIAVLLFGVYLLSRKEKTAITFIVD